MRRSLLELLDVHAELDELFFLHQERLLNLDLAGARTLLESYCRQLRAHIQMEERIVLPAYQALGITARGAGAHLVRAEHDKIGSWLDRLPGLLEPLTGRAELTFRDIVPILDRHCTFKHLLEHHDRRERVFLYPLLERELDAAAKRRLLEQIARFEEPAKEPAG